VRSWRPPSRTRHLIDEHADPVYSSGFIRALFEKEGGALWDSREAILGHVQEGGNPSPFNRTGATRLTARCIKYLSEQLESGARASAVVGVQSGRVQFIDLASYPTQIQNGCSGQSSNVGCTNARSLAR